MSAQKRADLLDFDPIRKIDSVKFAICVSGEADGDIGIWKVYQVLPDEEAIAVGCLRVIDESSEDYLYAQEQFFLVDLPEAARSQLLAAISP